jgi:hypothetical protein
LPAENFLNKKMAELQERDAAAWWRILGRLQRLLRTAAASLHARGAFTARQAHHYAMSVTEREVLKGCIEAESVKDHVILYTRIINNINMQTSRRAGAFIDLGLFFQSTVHMYTSLRLLYRSFAPLSSPVCTYSTAD